MNELIQALGQYTEALENKITSLTQQLAEQAKLIEELRLKIEELSADSRFCVRSNSSPSETPTLSLDTVFPINGNTMLRDSIVLLDRRSGVGCPVSTCRKCSLGLRPLLSIALLRTFGP